jgi:hypothetical protein
MPWPEITRVQYQRCGLRYASDMTDAEWALIKRRLPPRRLRPASATAGRAFSRPLCTALQATAKGAMRAGLHRLPFS